MRSADRGRNGSCWGQTGHKADFARSARLTQSGLAGFGLDGIPAHFQEQIAPTSVGKGKNKQALYFAYGFVIANGWIVQNPSINGYSGAFGYNLASGVTIVVAATKSETTTTDASAFAILREVVKYVTPASPINF